MSEQPPFPGSTPPPAWTTPPAPGAPIGSDPPGYYGYAPMQPAGTNGLAIASLILGIVGLFLFELLAIPNVLALIFAVVAKRQIRERQQSGAGLATAGLVLALIGLVFAAIFLAFVATGIHHVVTTCVNPDGSPC